ncbi:AbrB/MazE/SpoVT family DNA-binding domain-containing protein [Vulcanisaeta distributa]|uniref:AbrB/MazE/SpoVT family DNA-binding domain-containing protein n=1 Tax=Vulcanisaeta distributa TaxID=164451 RepID=UPI0006D0E45E|nr:AbrB/MazE/SpoVT family DNA-binding domain-containing protein [Vulcanisaeta distributa]
MASGISRVRRVRRSMVITKLPYVTKIYINYQVLIPASLVKALNIENVTYANITIEYFGQEITLEKVKLLRTRNTASRQFTIPKEIREKYGIKPLDEIKIKSIIPVE